MKQAERIDRIEKSLNEVRDGMADFENRILFQENLHTPSNASLEAPEVEDEPEGVIDGTPGLYSHLQKQIDQLKAYMNYLRNELNEHKDASKKKRVKDEPF